MATVSLQHRYLLVVAIIAVAATVPACYTLMKHPRIAELNYARPGNGRPCQSCHDGGELRSFSHPARLRPETEGWAAFYDRKWYRGGDAADSTQTSSEGSP